MGIKCSKASEEILPEEIVMMVFYDNSAYEENFTEQLRKLNADQMPYDDTVIPVSNDDIEFGLLWGYGLGRFSLRINVYRFLRKVGVFVMFVDHEITKELSGRYLTRQTQSVLSAPARQDAQVLVVVRCKEDADPKPSDEEMVKDVAELMDGCRQNLCIMASLDTPEATMKKVMDAVTGHVKYRLQQKENQKQLNTESPLVAKIKKLAKALPKTITM